jgi:hypothetical protein
MKRTRNKGVGKKMAEPTQYQLLLRYAALVIGSALYISQQAQTLCVTLLDTRCDMRIITWNCNMALEN